MATELRHQNRCSFCGARLSLGYHFTCHLCGAAYCYVHMSRHDTSHARPAKERMPSASSSGLVIIGQ